MKSTSPWRNDVSIGFHDHKGKRGRWGEGTKWFRESVGSWKVQQCRYLWEWSIVSSKTITCQCMQFVACRDVWSFVSVCVGHLYFKQHNLWMIWISEGGTCARRGHCVSCQAPFVKPRSIDSAHRFNRFNRYFVRLVFVQSVYPGPQFVARFLKSMVSWIPENIATI